MWYLYIWRLCLLASVPYCPVDPAIPRFHDHDWKKRIRFVSDLKQLPSQWRGVESLRNRWEIVEKSIQLAKLREKKEGRGEQSDSTARFEANGRTEASASARSEQFLLTLNRFSGSCSISNRWRQSGGCIRRWSTVLKHRQQRWRYDKRTRWAHLICALRQKSPASKPAWRRDKERERNGRRNPTIRYFAFLARPPVYPWNVETKKNIVWNFRRNSTLSMSLSLFLSFFVALVPK